MLFISFHISPAQWKSTLFRHRPLERSGTLPWSMSTASWTQAAQDTWPKPNHATRWNQWNKIHWTFNDPISTNIQISLYRLQLSFVYHILFRLGTMTNGSFKNTSLACAIFISSLIWYYHFLLESIWPSANSLNTFRIYLARDRTIMRNTCSSSIFHGSFINASMPQSSFP